MAIFSEGSNVNNSVFGKSQEPIKMLIEAQEEAYEQESALPHIFSMDESNSFAEKYTGMTAMGGFKPVGEGGKYGRSDMQEGFSKVLQHETWKNSFQITQEMIEDSKTIDLRKRPTAFIKSYGRTREEFGAAILAGATKGTTVTYNAKAFDVTGADSKALFAADHPSIISGSDLVQSNKFTDAFSVDALSYAEERMQNFKGDNGEILAVTPDTIVIPNNAALKKAVFAAIGADKDPATSNNGFNYEFGRWNVVVWPYLNNYLTATAGVLPWFLLSSSYNEEAGGLVWLDRIKLAVKSTIDDETDDNIWRGRARFTAGGNDWRAILAGGCAAGSSFTA